MLKTAFSSSAFVAAVLAVSFNVESKRGNATSPYQYGECI
jgi:hypothetical protein